jgi:hypothetical protein
VRLGLRRRWTIFVRAIRFARADNPLHRIFWAITKHADIMAIERGKTPGPACDAFIAARQGDRTRWAHRSVRSW